MKTQNNFSQRDFEKFRWLLQFTYFQRGIQQLPKFQLEQAEAPEGLAELLVETLGPQSVEVLREVLLDMNRTDLVKLLPETSSTPKGNTSMCDHIQMSSSPKLESTTPAKELELKQFFTDTDAKYSVSQF